ncbi:LysR family transcriptional regulator [Roseateles sp. L2-2]|uniref:LysR family transcriptional regulator n=1 Tax=Roseateles sp. L2-2 TaxID=3422597 RepID=UPI003D3655E7
METSIDLADMRAYAAVVTDGSFTAAAERLGIDKARMSRIVRRVEEKLGAQLLVRSTRHVHVTEVGRDYFERVVAILAAVDAAGAAVARQSGEPKGLLKITAGAEFGNLLVDEWTAEFLRQAPKVRVEAEYTNRLVDIVHEGIDVAIRVGALQDSGLSARRLGEVTYGLYASPDYLTSRPALSGLGDLKAHDLVMHAPRGRPGWTLVNGAATERVAQSPRCAVDNSIAARNLALAGLGIALLPRFLAGSAVAQGALRAVLPGWTRSPAPVHAVFASSRYMDPKVRGFVDLCVSRFEQVGA